MRRAVVIVTALLVLVLVLVLVAGGVVLGVGPALNSDAVRARIVATVERATGHAVRIGGRFEIAPGSLVALAPAISVEDVALLNGPGYSRADLVAARRVEAVVALLPLLAGRVEVRSVTVEGADALLERDGSGRGNWLAPARPDAPPPTSSTPRSRASAEVGPVRIEGGRIAWLGRPPVEIRSLTVTPSGGPVGGAVVFNGVPVTVGGSWNGPAFELTATGGGLALAVSRQQDGTVDVRANTADLAAASALAGRALPALHDVQMTGQVSGPASDQGRALKLSGHATWKALPMTVALDAGPRRGAAAPISLELTADGGKLAARGDYDLAGHAFEGAVSAEVPDLGRTGGLAGLTLPQLQDASLAARVLPVPGRAGVLLRGLRLTSSQADAAGDLAVTFAPRPTVRGSLVGQQWNLDRWGVDKPATTREPAVDPASPAAPAGKAAWTIPDRSLPFDALKRVDGDLQITLGQAILHGAAYRSIEARMVLQDGRLRLDPVRMVSPGGALQGQLSADATTTPPTAALTLHGPGLDAAGLMGTGVMAGTMDVDADLHGAGATWHAMAASLGGHVGVALVDGEVENALLARLFGPALRGVNLPVEAGGSSHVRCMAVRMEGNNGQIRVDTLALDTSRLRLDGDGALDLGNETMDMHLRPVIRIGGAGITVPVQLTGPFRSPRASADKGVLAPGRFGISITQLGAQLGAQLGGNGPADPCGTALAAVRDGAAAR